MKKHPILLQLLKIPEEIAYEDIAKDTWLFQPYSPCPLDDIFVINNGTGYYFCGDTSLNAASAGKNKRPLTIKERFTIELLRNNKCPS